MKVFNIEEMTGGNHFKQSVKIIDECNFLVVFSIGHIYPYKKTTVLISNSEFKVIGRKSFEEKTRSNIIVDGVERKIKRKVSNKTYKPFFINKDFGNFAQMKSFFNSFDMKFPVFGIVNVKTNQRQMFSKDGDETICAIYISNDATVALVRTKQKFYIYDIDV